ncbi:MAG: PilT/PilU family type 4a pilus ATPase [Lachnospiraceae bacterium]|nr:PilT/PilU family type 4a pilus ATPase [Lachnospiraceae bacterium]
MEFADFKELIEYAKQNECSDIHITVGTNLAIRRFGTLQIIEPAPSAELSRNMIYSFLDQDQVETVSSGKDLDVGVMLWDGTRIRANIYHQRNNLAASIRILNQSIPTFAELGLPPVVQELSEMPRGLVLVTGPTGSGKSTTLASMVDHINKTTSRHIMTIEDPIEYVYPHNMAMIHQREVGRDVTDFATALRSALREDPDIILVGEMRDFETISAAITAAETGHLVLSTLHTTSAAQTVERIIDATPLEGQDQIRTQFSNVIRGVITQTLLPTSDGKGRVVATEIMTNTPAVGNLIRDKKTIQLPSIIQSSRNVGMHLLNDDLASLIIHGRVTREEAMRVSNDPVALDKMC